MSSSKSVSKRGRFRHRLLAAFLLGVLALPVQPVLADGQLVDLDALRGGISAGTITCSTSATAVPTTALAGRRSISIVNISGNPVYIGPSTVTTANGFRLGDGESIGLDAGETITVYCIAGDDYEVRYLEIR